MNSTQVLALLSVLLGIVLSYPVFDYTEMAMSPEHHNHHHHHISPRSPKDRSLGFGGKKNKSKSSKRNYPWDSKASQVRLTYPESVARHERKDEEGFNDDYYDDYDFEFAKGMVKNGNWEGKAREMHGKQQQQQQ